MWTVTRQRQWPDGDTVVEISAGGLDYTNPDALAGKYPGEFEEFGDPREAVEAAIGIAEAWKADVPEEDIQIATGGTGGYTMPFDGEELTEETKQGLRDWANGVWEGFPGCDKCGDKITGKPVTLFEYGDDWKFCSDSCAERWYEEQQVGDEEEAETDDGLDDEASPLGLKSGSQGGAQMRYKCRACGRVTSKPGSVAPMEGRQMYTPTCDDPFCGATCDPLDAEQHAPESMAPSSRSPSSMAPSSTDIDRSVNEGTQRASAYHRILHTIKAMSRRPAKPDVRVENHGSVRILQPLSAAGAAWVKANLAVEPWQTIGGGIAIEPRMVENIIDGMEAAGLKVEAGVRASKAARGQDVAAPDAKVENLGSVHILQPLSAAGKVWTDENLAVESWQRIGGGIAIEPRMVQDIVDGMEADGLTVSTA